VIFKEEKESGREMVTRVEEGVLRWTEIRL